MVRHSETHQSARAESIRVSRPEVPAAHLMRDPVAKREAFNKRVTVMEAGVDAGCSDLIGIGVETCEPVGNAERPLGR